MTDEQRHELALQEIAEAKALEAVARTGDRDTVQAFADHLTAAGAQLVELPDDFGSPPVAELKAYVHEGADFVAQLMKTVRMLQKRGGSA